MTLATNITRRGGSANYYVRVIVPSDLRHIEGKREIWRSLGTSDPAEAKRLARPILDEMDAKWAALRAGRTIRQADIEHAVWNRYRDLLEADERFRAENPTDEDLDVIWAELCRRAGDEHDITAYRVFEIIRDRAAEDRRARQRRLAALKSALVVNNTKPAREAADAALSARGITGDPASPEYRRLAMGIIRADVEFLKRAAERDEGDYSGAATDPVVREPKSALAPAHPPGETIMELYQRFKREASGSVTSDTWRQSEAIVRIFADYAGKTSHVSVITPELVRDWKGALFQWPVKATEITAFKGMTFNEVIKANAKIDKPTISEKTINKYLSALGSYTSWLRTNRFIREDVMSGMYLQLDKSKQKIFPYSDDQLDTLFASPLFHLCAGDKQEHEIGTIAVRDWRYWIPLVGLYTGARLGEIAQMHVADVRKHVSGIWFFHITTEGERREEDLRKSVKTKGSARVVPIHRDLIRLGFLRYWENVRGQTQLFPEIVPDARGFWSGNPSGFFGDYFKAIGIKTDKTQNFHSFRHGIADAFRRAGYLDEQFGMLLGHTKGSTTGRYGIIAEGPLKQRAEMIEAVSFDIPALAALLAVSADSACRSFRMEALIKSGTG